MQRRQFLSVLTGAGLGSPLAASTQDKSPVETSAVVTELVRRLAEIDQEKMKLLTVLHEMRAPLHVMVLYAELILDNGCGETSDEQRAALHKIRQGGFQVADLINAGFAPELSKRRRKSVAA